MLAEVVEQLDEVAVRVEEIERLGLAVSAFRLAGPLHVGRLIEAIPVFEPSLSDAREGRIELRLVYVVIDFRTRGSFR